MRGMKRIVIGLFICAFLAILLAGCTTTPVTPPVTTTPPTTPVSTPVPTTSPITDPALVGTWYLLAWAGPGGANPVQTIGMQITAIFTSDGGLSGFGGCNNYNGQYTLTGQVLPDGKGITIGPIITTLMFCADSSTTEGTYLSILQNVTSYAVTTNQQLTLTDRDGSTLVFGPAPYGTTAVPIGS